MERLEQRKKPALPTLKGRLENALSSREEALRQLARIMPLSPYGQKLLERYDMRLAEEKKRGGFRT